MESHTPVEDQSNTEPLSKPVLKLPISKRRVFQKIVYIIIEILIIVVAVNLSIWLNNKNSQKNEDKVALAFLSGLKQDIKVDLEEIENNLEFYRNSKLVYTYLSQLGRAREFDQDTFDQAFGMIGSNAWLMPNRSRYEGFRQSGRLQYVRDDSLQNLILYYFEDAIPSLGKSEESWVSDHSKLRAYMIDHLVTNADGSNNAYEVITSAKAKNLCKNLIPWDQLFERYDRVRSTAEGIQSRIEELERTGFKN